MQSLHEQLGGTDANVGKGLAHLWNVLLNEPAVVLKKWLWKITKTNLDHEYFKIK